MRIVVVETSVRPSVALRSEIARHVVCSDPGMERPDLEIRTEAFATAVFGLTESIRSRPGGRRPADQLLDCATSVGANYRASARARSRAEFIAKLGIVAEEAGEAVYWLEFLWSVGLGDPATVERLLAEAKELRAIFATSHRTARRNHRDQQQMEKKISRQRS